MLHALKFNTGAVITLRDTTGKPHADGSQNHFLAARPESEPMVTRFGFNVPIALVGGQLPLTAELLVDGKPTGNKVQLDSDHTEKGNAKVSGVLPQPVDYDGVPQTIRIERISQPGSGKVNVLIRSRRPNQGSLHGSL